MAAVCVPTVSQRTVLPPLSSSIHAPFLFPLPRLHCRVSTTVAFTTRSARLPRLQIRASSSPSRSNGGVVVRAEASATNPAPFPVGEGDLVKEDVEVGGGGGESSGPGGSGGGGGGGGGGEQEGNGGPDDKGKKMAGLSMSQKLTLGYAALVGVGGVMGYVKGGSQKSLIAGGTSALILYFVHTQLPVRPVFASSLGLGLSAALLAVMGSRFKRSGKFFPAGVVSIVSFIMVGGYFHGILRSTHA